MYLVVESGKQLNLQSIQLRARYSSNAGVVFVVVVVVVVILDR